MYKYLRQVLVLQILLGIVLAFPDLGYAATVSDQISLDTDDADQDGIGSTTQLFNGTHKLGKDIHVAYRFAGHGLPNNAVILSASIQFTTESKSNGGSPSTVIVGEDADNAGTFVEQTNDITDRTTTSASVVWNIPAWPTDGESGPAQQTPDLSTIIQEIVDRPGWTAGNPLVFIFEPNGGNKERLAWAYDGSPSDAAVLSIEYTLLDIVKRASWLDGTPIPTSATIPSGVEFKYLLYINNPGAARIDVSVRDVLDGAFQYQTATIQVDNSVAECAVTGCTAVEELAIFNAANGATVLSDAVDGDVASYTGGSSSVDAGNSTESNLQLDVAADKVWAILFSVKMP